MKKLIQQLEEWFAKAPHLPAGVREVIVKIAPYLAIVGVVFTLPALLALLGLSSYGLPFVMMGGVGAAGWSLGIILSVVVLALEVLAIPGLFRRTMSGWNFVFYSVLVSAVQSLLAFSLGSLIIGTLIGFYILFEVRSYYR